jgi:hypothetical protein
MASLYGGKGSVLGWLTFINTPTPNVSGLINWIKPNTPGDVYYPIGFTNLIDIISSTYTAPPSGVRPLNLTNGIVILQDGNLPQAITNSFSWSAGNNIAISAPNTNFLTLKATLSTGVLKGTFIHPVTGQTNNLNGILLQQQNQAAGYFLGPTESGSLLLQAP